MNESPLHIVFDGPPGPEAGRFVEVEDPAGKSITVGEWRERSDGFWELVIDPHAGGTMQFREFHNALRVLLNIDMDEFIQAVFDKEYGEFGDKERAAWKAFKANPHMWFIRAGTPLDEKLWAYMQKRMKP